MFAKYMSEDVVTAEDAFNVALSECNTEQERQRLITDTLTALYGDAAETYREASGSMLDAKDATAENILQQNRLADAIEPVNTQWQELKNKGLEATIPVIEYICEVLTENEWIIKLTAVSVGLLSAAILAGIAVLAVFALTLVGVFTWIVIAIGAVIAVVITFWDEIKAFFVSIATWINDNVIQPVKNYFVNLWTEIVQTVQNIGQSIKDFFVQIGENIVSFFTQTIPNLIEQIGQWFNELPARIGYALGYAIGTLMKFGTDAINWVKTNVPLIINNIITFFKELPSKIWTWLKNTYDKVTTWGSQMSTKAKDTALNFINSAINTIKELPSKIWTWLQNTNSKVVTWGSDLASKGKAAAVKLFNSIVDKIKEIPTKMKSIGKDIVEGVWNGIKNATGWIKNKVGEFAKGILNGMKEALGIHSPSIVMRDEVGKQLAAGVAVGIDENTKEVEKSAEEMSQKVLTAAQKRLDEYKTYNELALSDEVAFWDEVRKQCAEGTDARINADKQYIDAKDKFNNQLLTAEENLQKRLDDIAKKVTDRQKSIVDQFDLFGNFTPETSGMSAPTELLTDLRGQIYALEEYDDMMTKLKGRIGDSALFEHLEELGIDSMEQIQYVSQMTDKELQEYVSLFDKRNEVAGKIAKKELKDEVITETEDAYKDFAIACGEIGVEVTNSIDLMKINAAKSFDELTTSISNNTQTLKGTLQNLRNTLNSATGITTGITTATAQVPLMASGGIFTKPTLNIAGEAGPEAIIPIDKLQTYISGSIEKTMQVLDMQSLIYAVEDLANRAIELNINGQKFATATAADTDIVNGSRMQLSKRGLAL